MEIITIPKLNEYQKFAGDDDWWSRMPLYKSLNSTKEWYLISSLIQDIKLVQTGLASNEYAEKLNNELIKYCDSDESIKEIKRMATLF